jgi:muramoyltetrapeptide carboxypeptidase
MRKPHALRPGDRVALVAPSSAFERGEFERGAAELTRLGFDTVYDDRLFARTGYVAGSPQTRAAAFLDAWEDDTVRALVAVRGGYGSAQLLPLLPLDRLRHQAKLFVGYSDTTSLLTVLTQQAGIVAVHGPMLEGRFAKGEEGYHRESFVSCVTRPEPMGELSPPGLFVVRPGDASGILTGGTISQLVASLATPFAFDPPRGCVLFLEDVRERPYRIDRMVTQLRYSGVLARAAAVVWGEMPGCDEGSEGPAARDVIAELFAEFPGPVLFGFPSGHTQGAAWTLPFGVRARVVADGRAALVIEEAAVEP